jgi:hypothetical protein
MNESHTTPVMSATQFQVGDHLMVPIAYRAFHHGIYLGDDHVAHWHDGAGGKTLGRDLRERIKRASIQITLLADFAAGRTVVRRDESAVFSPLEICERARSKVGSTGYHLSKNNCEHFVRWCRLGVHESQQVDAVETRLIQGARHLANSAAAGLAGRAVPALTRTALRGGPVVAVVAELAECGSRMIISQVRPDRPELARRGGKVASGATMAFAGLVAGGPMGAVAGATVWAVGELSSRAVLRTARKIVDRLC